MTSATLVPYLEDLGRDHRKFGTVAAHYPAVGEALIPRCVISAEAPGTTDLQRDWAAAYGIVAGHHGRGRRQGRRIRARVVGRRRHRCRSRARSTSRS